MWFFQFLRFALANNDDWRVCGNNVAQREMCVQRQLIMQNHCVRDVDTQNVVSVALNNL